MNNIKNLLITKSYTPKDVYEKINFKFDKKFDYTKIRNAYYKVKASLFGTPNNEAHELIKLLESLKNLGFIHFAAKAHPQNKNLEALVFASEGMISLYRSYKDILILDTTFGLNRFNMPVLTLAGVNNNGTTVIFGFAFLQDESSLLKEWVFDNFKQFSQEVPDAVITDGCPAFAKALKNSFPNATSYLCAWHIQLNLKKHFAGFKKKLKKGFLFIFLLI